MSLRKIVLITGANTGLGFETVKSLLASSTAYHILLAGRSIDKAKAAATALQSSENGTVSSLEALQIDVTDDDSILAAFKHVENSHGRLDVLINNAGDFPFVPFLLPPWL